MVRRLLYASCGLGVLNALFWTLVMWREGVFGLSVFLEINGVALCGPFGFLVRGDASNPLMWVLVWLSIIAVGVSFAIGCRAVGLCRIAGYVSVVLWFFAGNAVTLGGL